MPRAIAALAMTAALAAVPAHDAAADEGRSVASHIQGAGETVRPVAVIEREDIAFSGMRTVSDLLLSRLTYNSFGLHRPLVLGTGRAAVFINGRRISDSTLDLATLPTSAVERVEIFNGAASALHGGHAIAGAINIVLRRGYEGAEVSVFAGRPTDTGGVYEQGSALWGGAVGDGHLTIGVDVFQREEIPDAAREHSRAKWTPGGLFADASGVSIGGNTVFIATKSYDENGDVTATHVPGVDARSIGRPLGDCPGNIYTGELGKPRDVEGTDAASPTPMSHGTGHVTSERACFSASINRWTTPLTPTSITVWRPTKRWSALPPRSAPSQCRRRRSKLICCPIPRSTASRRPFWSPIASSVTAIVSGARRWMSTTSRSVWEGSSRTTWATTPTCASTATIPPSTAIPS